MLINYVRTFFNPNFSAYNMVQKLLTLQFISMQNCRYINMAVGSCMTGEATSLPLPSISKMIL